MKQIYSVLLSASAVVCFINVDSLKAQDFSSRLSSKPNNRIYQSIGEPKPITQSSIGVAWLVAGNKSLPQNRYGKVIGYTYHDWQYTTGAPQGIQKFNDGSIGVVWQFGRQGFVGSRGLAFNRLQPNGSWCAGDNGVLADSLAYQAAGSVTNYASTLNVRSIYDSKRTRSISLLPINNNDGFSLLTMSQGPNNRPYGRNGQVTDDSTSYVFRVSNYISPNTDCRPVNGFAYDRRLPMIDDPMYASDGSVLYVIGTTNDSVNTISREEYNYSGNAWPLIIGKSFDNGVTWHTKLITNTIRSNGFGSAFTLGAYNIDVKGNTVAIVANFMLHAPATGIATVLLKSTDAGNSFQTTLISLATVQDTNSVFQVSLPEYRACLTNDGAFSVLIDEKDNVHTTVARGYLLTDTLAEAFSRGYMNGGFNDPSAGKLFYWSENEVKGSSFRFIADYVDNNRNGKIEFSNNILSSHPDDYIQSTLSQSNLVQDRYGNLYVVYSALSEGTESCCNTKTTRDIYVIGSRDHGKTGSSPISMANLIGYDDGLSRGDGATEEFMPMTLKRLKEDDKLHTIFFADQSSGLNSNGVYAPGYSAANWFPSNVVYAAPTIHEFWKNFIIAKFKEGACAGVQDTVVWEAGSNCGFSPGKQLYVQIDTSSIGLFDNPAKIVNLATITLDTAKTGKIQFTIPSTIAAGNYKIRISSDISRAGCADTAHYPERKFFSSTIFGYKVHTSTSLTTRVISVNPGIDTFCTGTAVLLTGLNLPNDYAFQWSINDPTAVIVGNGKTAQVIFNASDTITKDYVISLAVSGFCGSVPPITKVLRAKANQLKIQANGTLFSPSSTSSTGYRWTYNGKLIRNVNTATYQPDANVKGLFCVQGPGVQCKACLNTAKINCTTPPKPSIRTSGQINSCNGQTVTLSAPDGYFGYLWSNGERTPSIKVSTSGSYSVQVVSWECSSEVSDPVVLNLGSPSFGPIRNESICQGSSVLFEGKTISIAGTYFDTLVNSSGCDSILQLNLTVNPTFLTVLKDSACTGTPFFFNNQSITQSGTYFDTLRSSKGCDSVIELQFSINRFYFVQLSESICEGDSFSFNNQQLNIAGVYRDTALSGGGCDSIILLNLKVLPLITTIGSSACEGQSFLFNNQLLTRPGQYYDTLQNFLGCDSIITLNFTVKPKSATTLTESACEGTPFTFNGSLLTQAGQYFDTLTNASGCDSIITLNFTVKPKSATTLTASICEGTPFTFKGNLLTQSGQYFDTLTNSSGCDSLITLNFTVKPKSATTLTESICEGTSFTFNGNLLTQSGQYFDTLTNASGCDSIITLNFTVKPKSAFSLNKTICSDSTFRFNNLILNTAGTYFDTLTNAAGCDSLVTLNLSIEQKPVKPTIFYTLLLNGTATFYTTTPHTGSFVWLRNMQPYSITVDSFISVPFPAWLANFSLVLISNNGCVSPRSDTVRVLSTPVMLPASSVKIFPNPASETVTIVTEEPIVSVELSNTLGQKVEAALNENRLNVQDLPKGVYRVLIQTTKGFANKTMVKQ